MKQKNKRIVISIAIILIIVFALIIISLINKDEADIKGIEYVINTDNESYTMKKSLSIRHIYTDLPRDLKIPENYKQKPVTKLSSLYCCHSIETIQGSVNLEIIEEDTLSCRCMDTTFLGKMNLRTVTFPSNSNLKSLGRYAFFKCAKLEKLILPENFESFGKGVFYGCENLKEIYIYNPVPPIGASTLFDEDAYTHTPPSGIKIFVPSKAIDSYQGSDWRNYDIQPIQ